MYVITVACIIPCFTALHFFGTSMAILIIFTLVPLVFSFHFHPYHFYVFTLYMWLLIPQPHIKEESVTLGAHAQKGLL